MQRNAITCGLKIGVAQLHCFQPNWASTAILAMLRSVALSTFVAIRFAVAFRTKVSLQDFACFLTCF